MCTTYEWRGDLSKIVKRIMYYYLCNLTVEQANIVSHVQTLIDMRYHSNYEHINETELSIHCFVLSKRKSIILMPYIIIFNCFFYVLLFSVFTVYYIDIPYIHVCV